MSSSSVVCSNMWCRQCEYDLTGLVIARCPECGHAFDPADPATFTTEWTKGVARTGIWIPFALATCPLFTLTGLYLTWLAARWSLGHWPRMNADDPKFIGLTVDALRAVTSLMMVLGLPCGVLGCLVTSIMYSSTTLDSVSRRRARLRLLVMFALTSLLVYLVVLKCDPGGVYEWFMD